MTVIGTFIYLNETSRATQECHAVGWIFVSSSVFSFYWLLSPKTELATVHFVRATRNFGGIAHFYLQYLFLHQNPFYPAPLPPNITQIQLLLCSPIVDSFGFREGAAHPAGDSLYPHTGPPAPSNLLVTFPCSQRDFPITLIYHVWNSRGTP